MKVALVHDFIREWGGAEEVVTALHDIWPQAPLFVAYYLTTLFDLKELPKSQDQALEEEATLAQVQLVTSWMQNLPDQLKNNIITPLLPYAFASFDFTDYDVVISSTSSFAKTIRVKKPTIHICYCHTPPRFLYGMQRERQKSSVLDILEIPVDWWLRSIDQASARSVDYFIANSQVVADRIKKIYGRGATVIYPPVDLKKFLLITDHQEMQRQIPDQVRHDKGEYFVTIGRLSPVKHFEIAVEACTKLNLPLKVIGTGIDEAHLKSIAGPTVEFLGRLSDQDIATILIDADALINPVIDEDFGITPLEVLAAGKPVIAYASEAAKETMIDGVTGQFFFEPTPQSLVSVLEHFDSNQYDPRKLKDHAQQFSKKRFQTELKALVEQITQ